MQVEASPGARKIRAFLLSLFGSLVLAAGSWAGGAPSTFNVNSTADAIDDNTADGQCHAAIINKCTLRAAVMQANQMTSDSTIVLPAGTYFLTIAPAGANGDDSGDLNLMAGGEVISISGASAATTIIDADQIVDRVLDVGPGDIVNVSGVTLRNGTATAGGIIRNQGVLTMSYCTLSGGSATHGGGLYSVGGTATVSDCTVSGNHAEGYGGGLYSSSGVFEVHRTTISGNDAFVGGGIYHGGATMYVYNSTISGNESLDAGGGIYVDGTVWTYNASIVFNHANTAEEFLGNGGGVFVDPGDSFFPRNSLMAGNEFSDLGNIDCWGTAGIFGTNWFGTTAGCTIVPQTVTAWSSTVNSLAELGPLRFNGGPTRTHALQAGSAMIDTGFACNGLGDPPIDQRGGAREPVLPDQLCDAGAFEYNALPAGLIFADGFELGNLWAWG